MYDEILEQFMPSVEMRKYLKGKELSAWRLTRMIYYSPVSIEKKKEAFYALYESAKKDNDTKLVEESRNRLDNIEAFLELLTHEGVFTISLCLYDEETNDVVYDFYNVCASMEDVLEVEAWDKQNRELEQDERYWYSVEKWIKNKEGKYEIGGECILSRGEIILSEVNQIYKKGLDHIDMYGCTDVNLPVPYKAGDILEIDGFPFGPKQRILILQIGDNDDCCCVQALSRNEEGIWHVGAVKHGMIGRYHEFPHISPLYSAKKCQDVMQDEDGMLFLAIQKYLDGDDEKGEELCERFAYDMTDEEIFEKCKDIL